MKLFKKKIEEVSEEEEKLDLDSKADISIQVAKLAAKVESMLDIRKSYSERFTMFSEQLGELRGMILDNSKQIQKMEVSSTKAIELVNEVQPEKFMSQIRKIEATADALKASLESKEAIMKDITEELQKIRKQMSFYRGIEQVTKLNEEIKKDLFKIKKVQSEVERHSDKTESIFIDLQKKYGQLDNYASAIEEFEKMTKDLARNFDKIQLHMEEKAEKKEISDIKNKVESFVSESRLQKLKEFTHDIENFRKRSEDNFEMLKTVKQRTDDLILQFENAGIHEFKMELKNYEKARDLIKVEVDRNKEILDEFVKEQAQFKKIKSLAHSQSVLKKQIDDLSKTQESIQKSMSKLSRITAVENKLDANSAELQKSINQIRRKVSILERQSALTELKGMGRGISKLEKAFRPGRKKLVAQSIRNVKVVKKKTKAKSSKSTRTAKSRKKKGKHKASKPAKKSSNKTSPKKSKSKKKKK